MVWEKDLEKAKELDPSSVTCYSLSILEKTGIYRMHEQERGRFPGRRDVLIMQIMAVETFGDLGYTEIPPGWFVKDPKWRQPRYKFTKSSDQLSFGVSSYSFVDGVQYLNRRNISNYLHDIDEGRAPICRAARLSKDDLKRRAVVFGLKVGIDRNWFREKFGTEVCEVDVGEWESLKKLDLIEEDALGARLTQKGMLFSEEVCQRFYSKKIKRSVGIDFERFGSGTM